MHDRLRHRRRRRTTIEIALRVAELDHHHELRRVRRKDAGEVRIVLTRRIATRDDAAWRAGLSRERVRGEIRFDRGPALDDAREQLSHGTRDVLGHDAPHDASRVAKAHLALRRADFFHDDWFQKLTAVRDRGIRKRELQRSDRHFIPHSERSGCLSRPRARRTQRAGGLRRIGYPRLRAQPEVPQRLEFFPGRQAIGELHDADVAREADHVRQGERRGRRPRMRLVVDRTSMQLVRSSACRHDIGRARLPLREQCRCDQRLERGPRFEGLGDRSSRGGHDSMSLPRHRQHLAATGVQDHDVAALRIHSRDGVRQRALGNVLQLVIDG